MSEFVKCHEDAEHDDEPKSLLHDDKYGIGRPRERSEHECVLYPFPAIACTRAPAFSRAQRSASSASSRVRICRRVCASIVLRMTSAMSRNPIPSWRYAATAISLAAFKTAGMVPPILRAS